MSYCPRCGTPLSSHEVAQGYKDVEDTSVYVRFAVEGEANTYFAVWTTTPWTLPSNVALCVNPSETYVLVEVEEDRHTCGCNHHAEDNNAYDHDSVTKRRYYLAKALIKDVFGEETKYSILEEMVGRDLAGKTYQPLLPYATELIKEHGGKAFIVTADNYVTMSDYRYCSHCTCLW